MEGPTTPWEHHLWKLPRRFRSAASGLLARRHGGLDQRDEALESLRHAAVEEQIQPFASGLVRDRCAGCSVLSGIDVIWKMCQQIGNRSNKQSGSYWLLA